MGNYTWVYLCMSASVYACVYKSIMKIQRSTRGQESLTRIEVTEDLVENTAGQVLPLGTEAGEEGGLLCPVCFNVLFGHFIMYIYFLFSRLFIEKKNRHAPVESPSI